ncbi:MAG: NusG domain II-containing protein [Bacilli bacterium]|nr:NusG domain II-containing protein [Bacilli bacterium]
MDKKTLRNDIILVVSLLLVAIISLIVVLSTRTRTNLIAKVYVQNDIVETIDLSKKEEKDYTVHGLNGDLTIHTRDGQICVLKSNCPHQDCVKMGYIGSSNRPIICAYNDVYIVIEGNAEYDVEI